MRVCRPGDSNGFQRVRVGCAARTPDVAAVVSLRRRPRELPVSRGGYPGVFPNNTAAPPALPPAAPHRPGNPDQHVFIGQGARASGSGRHRCVCVNPGCPVLRARDQTIGTRPHYSRPLYRPRATAAASATAVTTAAAARPPATTAAASATLWPFPARTSSSSSLHSAVGH